MAVEPKLVNAAGQPLVPRADDRPRLQARDRFGGGGFIGRYVCEQLLDSRRSSPGASSRDPRSAHYIQPLSQVGQFGIVRADVTDHEIGARGGRGRGRGDQPRRLLREHGQGPGRRRRKHCCSCARSGGQGAGPHFGDRRRRRKRGGSTPAPRAKAKRRFARPFPSATIIRPSIVFGPEDQLTNRLAGMSRLPVLPVIAPESRFQPVFVEDLAKAIASGRSTRRNTAATLTRSAARRCCHHARSDASKSSRPPAATPGLGRRARAGCVADLAVRFPARRAAHPRPVADAPARQCRKRGFRRARSVRDQPDAVRRGRSRMARHVRRQPLRAPPREPDGQLR